MNTKIIVVDYANPQHANDLVMLLDSYSRDPMGANQALSETTKRQLADELGKIPGAFSVICYVDNSPAGLANCLMGFSTFQCKPLVNIHDIAVHPDFRGKGLGPLLLAKTEKIARQRGCCRLTLEVLEGNQIARSAYQKFGFAGYQLDPKLGQAHFWEKTLEPS